MSTAEIVVGCGGFPVARAAYFSRLRAVEMRSSFFALPRLETARRWREEAPEGFVYSLLASRLVTHPKGHPAYEKRSSRLSPRALERCGHLRPTDEVAAAFDSTRAVAEALGARFVLFETPSSFYPNADHLRDLYRFFKGLKRGGWTPVWEPRGQAWEPKLVARACADLGLTPAGNPLAGRPGLRYMRLLGGEERGRHSYGHRFTDEELRRLALAAGPGPGFLFFGNADMWRDAGRFQDLVRPPLVPRRAAASRG